MDPPLPVTVLDGYEAGGCHAATRYCRVTPQGELTPCPYMEISAGSLRERGFAELWRDAPLFEQLRTPQLEGRCGACEFQKICGGCRARPQARDGNLMGEDFLCGYDPRGGAIIEPIGPIAGTMKWTEGAQTRLSHVPSFVRRFVRQRAEAYAREQGAAAVLAEHLDALARRRFGDTGPPAAFKAAGRPGKTPVRDGRI
jgi:radical SAM protein with 4Fe4S-binding SPASM domain